MEGTLMTERVVQLVSKRMQLMRKVVWPHEEAS